MKPHFAILLAGILLAVALADEKDDERLSEVTKQCAEEHKLDVQESKDLMSGKKPLSEASANLKCVLRCIMEKGGFMDPATSKFLPDAVRALEGDNPRLEEALSKCESVDNANPCVKAFQIVICMMKDPSNEVSA